MNSIYITLKPLAARLGISHRTLEKIIIKEIRKGNQAPRYQLPHARSYVYIFKEFQPWFQKLLKLAEVKKVKKKQLAELMDHLKQEKYSNLTRHKESNLIDSYLNEQR
jgi:transcriptional regulator with XRE-family HTH domain